MELNVVFAEERRGAPQFSPEFINTSISLFFHAAHVGQVKCKWPRVHKRSSNNRKDSPRQRSNNIFFSTKGSKRALVYEFMPHESLDKCVFPGEGNTSLSWEKMYQISLGAA